MVGSSKWGVKAASLVLLLFLLASCGFTSNATVATSVSSTLISTTTTLPAVTLTNFGATIQRWNLSHTPDPSAPSNYWPRLSDGRDTYSSLNVQDGVVLGFTLALYPSISPGSAQVLAKNLMPPTESVVSTTHGSACETYHFSKFNGHSPFASLVFDGNGGVKSIIFGVDTTTIGC